MVFTVGAISADDADGDNQPIRIDRSTESNKIERSKELVRTPERINNDDCINESGNEQITCEESSEMDKAGAVPNQKSTINRNKNRQIRDSIKSKGTGAGSGVTVPSN